MGLSRSQKPSSYWWYSSPIYGTQLSPPHWDPRTHLRLGGAGSAPLLFRWTGGGGILGPSAPQNWRQRKPTEAEGKMMGNGVQKFSQVMSWCGKWPAFHTWILMDPHGFIPRKLLVTFRGISISRLQGALKFVLLWRTQVDCIPI